MDTISICNWEKYQHYSKRNPPWIKLHNQILDNYEYGCLQDASKLLLMSFYMLASRTENKIPADPEWIRSKAMLKGKIDWEPLLNAGFIKVNSNGLQDASTMLASCKQNGGTETETETEESNPLSIFEAFWNSYPKKKNKGDAIKAWRKIEEPNKTLDKILTALEWQKNCDQWQKEDGQFIPYPASYLNARAWEDEPYGNQTSSKDDDNLFLRMLREERERKANKRVGRGTPSIPGSPGDPSGGKIP